MLAMKKFWNTTSMCRRVCISPSSLSKRNGTITTVSSSFQGNLCRSVLVGHTAHNTTNFRCLSTGSLQGDVTAVSSSSCSPISSLPDPSTVNVVEYIESIQQTGNVAVFFSDAPPVLLTVDMLCALKDLPGMTWLSTIVCSTLLIRTVVGLPVAVAQTKAMERLVNLKPELQTLGEELKLETAIAIKKFNWDKKTAHRQFTKSYKKHWRKLVENNNCHPMKSLALSLTQLPFWICLSSALRNIVYAVPLPRTSEKAERWVQIHNEGTPWVESLVIPDPVVFPIVFLVTNFLNIEFTRRQRLQTLPETKFQKVFPWVIRGGIVAIAFIATSVPSAVSMYWATSSTLAFAQNLFLSRPEIKKLFKLSTATTTPPSTSSQK